MTFADLVYIDATGFHYPDYPTILQWLTSQYQAIYGADVVLDSSSQDGQWVAVQAQALYDCASMGAAIYNSFSPSTGQGAGLARNVKINGIRKQAASNSTADLTIVGTAGVTITNGVAQDTNGNLWNLPASVTIPGSGTITVTSTAQNQGAISASANTINKIYTPTYGWQTVNNANAATVGVAVETDAALRIRQASSVALPSLTVFEGTVGAVQNVSGVTAIRGYENATGSTDTNGIPAHAICIVAQGGTIADITTAIAKHKTPGTLTYGNTSNVVYDSHGMPLTIAFQRPTTAEIKARVTISQKVGWTSDYITLIQQAVAATINAGKIGDKVLITKLYAPAYLIGTQAGNTFNISLIEIALIANAFGTVDIPLNFDQIPYCNPLTDVTVVVT